MGICEPPRPLLSTKTPLIAEAWEDTLQHHPDRRFANYIVRGIREGFRIGANRDKLVNPVFSNLPSASVQSQLAPGRFRAAPDNVIIQVVVN